jgi:hypothetical protein
MSARLAGVGALERWQEEIRLGKRQNDANSFDELHAAACSEFTAQQMAAEEDWSGARRFLDRALLRLNGFWGEPESDKGRVLLKELKRTAVTKPEVDAGLLGSSWTAVSAPQGWR